MIKVIPYKHEHLVSIDLKDIHQGEVPPEVTTDAVTFMDGETVLAIFGGFFFVPGIFHIWGLVSPHVHKKPVAFRRSVGDFLSYFERKYKPRRLQIDIRVGHPELDRWAESIGFEREGIMKAYGTDKSDYYLYGRVNPWAQ